MRFLGRFGYEIINRLLGSIWRELVDTTTKVLKDIYRRTKERDNGVRGSRHRVHPCFCIYFLETSNDFKLYGCTEHHYVLDLFLWFFHSLATPRWINYYIVLIHYIYLVLFGQHWRVFARSLRLRDDDPQGYE